MANAGSATSAQDFSTTRAVACSARNDRENGAGRVFRITPPMASALWVCPSLARVDFFFATPRAATFSPSPLVGTGTFFAVPPHISVGRLFFHHTPFRRSDVSPLSVSAPHISAGRLFSPHPAPLLFIHHLSLAQVHFSQPPLVGAGCISGTMCFCHFERREYNDRSREIRRGSAISVQDFSIPLRFSRNDREKK